MKRKECIAWERSVELQRISSECEPQGEKGYGIAWDRGSVSENERVLKVSCRASEKGVDEGGQK